MRPTLGFETEVSVFHRGISGRDNRVKWCGRNSGMRKLWSSLRVNCIELRGVD